ncbi:cytochrome P450 [Streptomyces sp. NPDC001514]
MTTIVRADLTNLDHFANGFPHDLFARLRREAPVGWHEPTEHTPRGSGFWSVHTYAESRTILLDPAVFSSAQGTVLFDHPWAGYMMNMMDDPRHARLRRLVSGGFTPRMVNRLEDELRRRTKTLIDTAVEMGQCDLVESVTCELPLQAICMLMGIPQQDRHILSEWVHHVFDVKADSAVDGSAAAATESLLQYGREIVAERRRNPQDDLLSVITHAHLPDEDPAHLMEPEIDAFFQLLFGAGADATRSAASWALVAMSADPTIPDAVADNPSVLTTLPDEAVRMMSPVAHNVRTATQDYELAGHRISAGDRVVYWLASANRDEAMFCDPQRLDVRREPNPHLGFAQGPHFCLGAGLARLELRVILGEFAARVERVELTGDVEWTRSNKYNGINRIPAALAPRRTRPAPRGGRSTGVRGVGRAGGCPARDRPQ